MVRDEVMGQVMLWVMNGEGLDRIWMKVWLGLGKDLGKV